MKKNWFLFTLLVCSMPHFANGQTTGIIPDDESKIEAKEMQKTPLINAFKSATGITCNSNVFWAIRGTGEIDELSIIGNNVTLVGTLSIPNAEPSLGFANNVDGGSFSPTFYSTDLSNKPKYYNGTSWVASTISVSPDKIYNPGGFGSDLYYTYGSSTNVSIGVVKYTGTNIIPIMTWGPNRRSTVADLAVDNAGNVWFCTGPGMGGLFISDTLYVISPTGQVLHQYDFYMDSYNAYGIMMLNNSLYIALGNSHSTNPNTLVPVILSGNTATAGTPIPMPTPLVAYSDLASCNPGSPLGVLENTTYSILDIYPNPINENIIIYLPEALKGDFQVNILNAVGKSVYTANEKFTADNTKLKLDVRLLAQGYYIVELRSADMLFTGKVIKE